MGEAQWKTLPGSLPQALVVLMLQERACSASRSLSLFPLPDPKFVIKKKKKSIPISYFTPDIQLSTILTSSRQNPRKCTLLLGGWVDSYTCLFQWHKTNISLHPDLQKTNKQKPSEAEPLFEYCICVHLSTMPLLLTRSVCQPFQI